MPNLDACIVAKCQESWEEQWIPGALNKNNCSGFVKAVAAKLNIPLPATADADAIITHIQDRWTIIPTGAKAALEAAAGQFVLAVLKSTNHTPARNNGHVAIVVSGPLYRNTYPLVWGGSIGGAQSQGNKSVGEVWNRSDRDNVSYYKFAQQICR